MIMRVNTSRSSEVQQALRTAVAPAAIDRKGKRLMIRGISDLLGNVWEWSVSEQYFEEPTISLAIDDDLSRIEFRGGGSLDDMARARPFLDVSRLRDGLDTRHSDLGFRTAVQIPIRSLPEEIQIRLSLSRPLRERDMRFERATISANYQATRIGSIR